jgi:hypothetical protein
MEEKNDRIEEIIRFRRRIIGLRWRIIGGGN